MILLFMKGKMTTTSRISKKQFYTIPFIQHTINAVLTKGSGGCLQNRDKLANKSRTNSKKYKEKRKIDKQNKDSDLN